MKKWCDHCGPVEADGDYCPACVKRGEGGPRPLRPLTSELEQLHRGRLLRLGHFATMSDSEFNALYAPRTS